MRSTFVSQDPFGLAGVNVYAYVNANPVNNIDPEGLMAVPAPGVGVAPFPPSAEWVPGTKENAEWVRNTGEALRQIAERVSDAVNSLPPPRCYTTYLSELAQCTRDAVKTVCSNPDVTDTGFAKCKEGADRRLRICLRGGHLRSIGGRGW